MSCVTYLRLLMKLVFEPGPGACCGSASNALVKKVLLCRHLVFDVHTPVSAYAAFWQLTDYKTSAYTECWSERLNTGSIRHSNEC